MRTLRLTIQPREIRDADDFDRVFAALNKERPDGFYMLASSSLTRPNQKRIVGFTLKSRLPSMYANREYVEAGGLMSYGADAADSYKRVAYFVDRILQGAKRRAGRQIPLTCYLPTEGAESLEPFEWLLISGARGSRWLS